MNSPVTEPPVLPSPGQGPLPYRQERADELLRRLGAVVSEAVAAGWLRIDVRVVMTVSAGDIALTVVGADGRPAPAPPPPVVEQIAAELRSMLYEPGRGTWFGMRFMVEPSGRSWVHYNTSFDPGARPPIPPEAYADDLAAFPRADDQIPGWLRGKLAYGGQAR